MSARDPHTPKFPASARAAQKPRDIGRFDQAARNQLDPF